MAELSTWVWCFGMFTIDRGKRQGSHEPWCEQIIHQCVKVIVIFSIQGSHHQAEMGIPTEVSD